jgi:hypothetical protein
MLDWIFDLHRYKIKKVRRQKQKYELVRIDESVYAKLADLDS